MRKQREVERERGDEMGWGGGGGRERPRGNEWSRIRTCDEGWIEGGEEGGGRLGGRGRREISKLASDIRYISLICICITVYYK